MNELDCGDYVHYKDIPGIKQLWLDRDDLLSEYLKITRSVKEIKQKLRENKRKIVFFLHCRDAAYLARALRGNDSASRTQWQKKHPLPLDNRP